MDPEEVQVIITELEAQRSIMGARAADYARQNYRLMKEIKELKKQLEIATPKDPPYGPQPNGEDRDPPNMPFAQRLNT